MSLYACLILLCTGKDPAEYDCDCGSITGGNPLNVVEESDTEDEFQRWKLIN